MENSKLNLKKIKEILKDSIVRTILVSLLTVVITLGIVGGLAWYYREALFKALSVNLSKVNPIIAGNLITLPSESTTNENVTPLSDSIAPQNTVISAVKKAKPAVVSIVVSKEVPKYDVSYDQNDGANPFGSLFPGFFFQTPIYKQNGTEKKQVGSGSGFLISPDGLIVTNRHVVSDKNAIYEVSLNNGKKYNAQVLARDQVLDVAIMKISGKDLPYLSLADSDAIEVGESVIAIGNALGEFKNTVSVGVVSGLSRSLVAGDGMGQTERLDKVIQTDAAINPGNSGGPLLNLAGQVLGINVAIVQGSSNVGFALPVNSIKSVIDSVKKSGKIIRPYIGIRFIPITESVKSKNNLSVDYGVLVQRGQTPADIAVIPGSPADKAGILENDIILEIDGVKINQDNDFMSIIRSKKVGDYINLKIMTKGLEKNVSLRLEAAPEGM